MKSFQLVYHFKMKNSWLKRVLMPRKAFLQTIWKHVNWKWLFFYHMICVYFMIIISWRTPHMIYRKTRNNHITFSLVWLHTLSSQTRYCVFKKWTKSYAYDHAVSMKKPFQRLQWDTIINMERVSLAFN